MIQSISFPNIYEKKNMVFKETPGESSFFFLHFGFFLSFLVSVKHNFATSHKGVTHAPSRLKTPSIFFPFPWTVRQLPTLLLFLLIQSFHFPSLSSFFSPPRLPSLPSFLSFLFSSFSCSCFILLFFSSPPSLLFLLHAPPPPSFFSYSVFLSSHWPPLTHSSLYHFPHHFVNLWKFMALGVDKPKAQTSLLVFHVSFTPLHSYSSPLFLMVPRSFSVLSLFHPHSAAFLILSPLTRRETKNAETRWHKWKFLSSAQNSKFLISR